jgi:ATP-dependent DNA helicase RecQ
VLRGETEVWLREEAPGTRVRGSRSKSRRGDLAPAADAPQGDVDPELRARLRAWRSDIARERGVPAYVVLHDATIDGIVRAWPTTLDELRNVPGIGDKKLEHYGDELLQIVRTR